MALFQPTNIIPSSFTVGVVDANKDMAQVSWQVNGNSAMTAYQIDFYQNDINSTYVTSTNKSPLSSGFYGTDRFGQPKMFTWNAGQSWSEYNSGFTNGSQYKFKITQWYSGHDSVISCETATALNQGKTYYFQEQDGSAIIVFTAFETLVGGNNDIYYSYTTGDVWVDTRRRIVICNGYRVADGIVPKEALEVTGNISQKTLNELFTEQSDSNIFVTRDSPTLDIQRSRNNEFTDIIAFPNGSTLPSSIGYFVGNYTQAQGAPVREVRWRVATWENGSVGEIIADTGDVDTPTLQYEFNGFFIGNEYAVRCSGKADYQTYGTQDFDSLWKNFTAKLPDGQQQNDYTGNFTVKCLSKENAVLLQWDAVDVIPPSYSPEGYTPITTNGYVTLPAKDDDGEYSVTWKEKYIIKESEQQSIPINFSSPWAIVWKGKIQQNGEITNFHKVQTLDLEKEAGYILKYSPDGRFLFWYAAGVGYLCIYNVYPQLALVGYVVSSGQIVKNPIKFSEDRYGVEDIAFSSTNNLLAVGTIENIYLYTFINGDLKLISQGGASVALAFSPDGKYLAAGGYDDNFINKTHAATIYSVNKGVTKLLSLKDENGQDVTANGVSIDFNYDGSLLCLGTMNGAYLYSFDGIKASFIQKLPSIDYCYNCVFNKVSNKGDMLIIAAGKTFYNINVSNGKVQFINTITDIDVTYQGISRSIAFSPKGDYLIIGALTKVNWYKADKYLTFMGNINVESWNNPIAITWNQQISRIAIHNDPVRDDMSKSFITTINPIFKYSYFPQGKLLEVQGNAIQLVAAENILSVQNDGNTLAKFTYPAEATKTAVVVTPTAAYAFFYGVEGLISQDSAPIMYAQQSVTSVAIFGGDSGTTVDSVSVYQGNGSNVLNLYKDSYFEPVWNSQEYSLYMTANFNGNLEGGTGTASGNGFRIYRREEGSDILFPIANVKSTVTTLKDFGIQSRKAYSYSLFAYDINGAFMASVENETVVSTCFQNYSLLVCDYDSENDAYHVRKQYLFALNLSEGSVGNNNSPTLNANFTAYPTRMPSSQNYASGTLQGPIGAIYTVPALIEQIGGFKHTAKPSTLDYFDSVDLEKELYELSIAPYQLFLRDMKGHLRMVATSGAISMMQDLKKRQLSTTISLPWVEIGDASDVMIIQTPEDYGWNNDGQVLDVRLDVDPTTGVLSATYPKPYTGTKFYLTGVNKEILGAKTPLGVTPAQFALSEKTNEPDDGILSATAKVNTEEGD